MWKLIGTAIAAFVRLLFLPALLVAVVVAAVHLPEASGYLDASIYRNVLRLTLAAATVYGLVMASRWLDWRAGISFREEWSEIRKGNLAVSVYLGLRILAIFAFGGCVMLLS